MSRQQSVQQQNAATKAEIQRLAARFAGDPQGFSWLCAVLVSNGLDPNAGLLVRLSGLADQEGHLMSGLWLTQTQEFWEFALLLSRSTGELLGVEQFANVTRSVAVSAHARGSGRSFGFLACEVLGERGGR